MDEILRGMMTASHMSRSGITMVVLAILALGACGSPAHSETTATGAPTATTSPPSTALPSPSRIPFPPPVVYKPSLPERTRTTASGYRVNTCVPRTLDRGAFTLTTSDGVHLSALELGSGERGVLLAHEQGYYICSWLALGEELAAAGYHVMLFEYRNHNASEPSTDNDHIDRDVRAALAALHNRGARQVLMAGASCGGTSSAVVAAGEPHLAGLLILSSPAHCASQDGETAVRSITSPSFFAVSPGDYSGNMIKEVRKLYKASAASNKHLEIVPGGRHGTDMLREDHPEHLHQLVRAFIDSAFRR